MIRLYTFSAIGTGHGQMEKAHPCADFEPVAAVEVQPDQLCRAQLVNPVGVRACKGARLGHDGATSPEGLYL